MSNFETTAFLSASADLLQSAFQEAKAQDPEGAEGLSRALQAGAMLTLRATFAPSTGLAQVAAEVIEPNGVAHTLMTADLSKA